MNVHEHERTSNTQMTQIKVTEQRFYCCSTFKSHSRVFRIA